MLQRCSSSPGVLFYPGETPPLPCDPNSAQASHTADPVYRHHTHLLGMAWIHQSCMKVTPVTAPISSGHVFARVAEPVSIFLPKPLSVLLALLPSRCSLFPQTWGTGCLILLPCIPTARLFTIPSEIKHLAVSPAQSLCAHVVWGTSTCGMSHILVACNMGAVSMWYV